MVPNIEYVIFGIFFLWFLIITYFLWRNNSHYSKLTKGVNNKNLKFIMENIVKEMTITKKDISGLKNYCQRIENDGKFHIQKVGLVRYNPFKDTGGDQSFILSLVDGNNTGVVISGLYSRSGTRWYAKKVVDGKGADYDLSDEEKRALKDARGVN
ncbi:DUF4446 family protein [Patescibacteria group bacterium]|nr:DUF4446 family protein [Patescibacteria group bacterium]